VAWVARPAIVSPVGSPALNVAVYAGTNIAVQA
jgi:hypothetical protein